jgi:tetratricopeptide (TPR) repeat protein
VSQLAKCLLALEDFQGALNCFKQSAEIAPDEADTYYHMANCYEKLDQIEEAKKMYRKAIDLNPREAVYYHSLGFLYENIGDHKDAIVCFKKAMDLERDRGGAVVTREIATSEEENVRRRLKTFGSCSSAQGE